MAKKPNGPTVCKARRVKVYEGRAVSGMRCTYYPQIRISGQWLADCGFAPGQHLQITPGKHRLVIQLVNAPATDQNAAVTKLNTVAEKLPAAVRKPGRRANVPYATAQKQNEAVTELIAPAEKLNSINQKPKSNSGLHWLDVPFF